MGKFCQGKAREGELTNLERLDQPVRRLLQQYCHQGVVVMISGSYWKKEEQRRVLDRGSHKSTMADFPFLREKFSSVMGKGKWLVLL